MKRLYKTVKHSSWIKRDRVNGDVEVQGRTEEMVANCLEGRVRSCRIVAHRGMSAIPDNSEIIGFTEVRAYRSNTMIMIDGFSECFYFFVPIRIHVGEFARVHLFEQLCRGYPTQNKVNIDGLEVLDESGKTIFEYMEDDKYYFK